MNRIDIPVSDIAVLDRLRKEVDPAAVTKLAESIGKVGLYTPITVRKERMQGPWILVAGYHRLLAYKQLGLRSIPCFKFMGFDVTRARLWEIGENLHRADLTVMERSEHVAEWINLTEETHAAQVAPHQKLDNNPVVSTLPSVNSTSTAPQHNVPSKSTASFPKPKKLPEKLGSLTTNLH